jgi:peptidoglycan hydrolase-like protein with peptidoglycan-binding domain
MQSTPAIPGTLQEGSKGALVIAIQETMKDGGFYSGAIDGIFGPRTKQSVIQFQRSQQLSADGIVGERTLAKFREVFPRFNHQVVEVQSFITSNQLQALNPKAVATSLFKGTAEEEGRSLEEISITYSRDRRMAVILWTIVGLADDSVRAMRFRIELGIVLSQNKWTIVWVGRQFKCQAGRGQQDWAAALCA